MSDIDRLKRLAEDGDKTAAQRLQTLSERHADRDAHALASLALGDAKAIAKRIARAWSAQDWSTVTAEGQQLGIVLDETWAKAIDTQLNTPSPGYSAYDHYTTHTDLLLTLFAARTNQSGIAWCKGNVAGSYSYTQVALAVRHCTPRQGEHIALGFAWSKAAKVTPGTAWRKELTPWFQVPEKNRKRLERWLRKRKLVRVPVAESTNIVSTLRDDAKDPLHPLRALLEGEPSEKAFQLILKRLKTLAKSTHAEAALSLAEKALETWPITTRTGTKNWFQQVVRASTPLPKNLGLVRMLKLKNTQAEQWHALQEHAAKLGELTVMKLHSEPRGRMAPELRQAVTQSFASPAFANLQHLFVDNVTQAASSLTALLSSPHLANLSSLNIRQPKTVRARQTLSVSMTGLHSLWLDNVIENPNVLAGVLRALPQLHALRLAFFENARLELKPSIIAALESMPKLHTLWLIGADLSPDDLNALTTSKLKLKHLLLESTLGVGMTADTMLERLSVWPALSGLETLVMGLHHSNRTSPAVLLRSSQLKSAPLRRLDLRHTSVDIKAAQQLAKHYASKLEHLVVKHYNTDPDAQKYLREHFPDNVLSIFHASRRYASPPRLLTWDLGW